MPKDWSVTVWADKEPVELKHTRGLESKTWDNWDPIDPAIEIPKNFVDKSKETPEEKVKEEEAKDPIEVFESENSKESLMRHTFLKTLDFGA